jgi:hypothetical protein
MKIYYKADDMEYDAFQIGYDTPPSWFNPENNDIPAELLDFFGSWVVRAESADKRQDRYALWSNEAINTYFSFY